MRQSAVVCMTLMVLSIPLSFVHAASPQPPRTLEEVLQTVVLVRTGKQAGSGLLWGRPDQIVTALHVVAGGERFSVTYNVGDTPVTRDATFVCCIPEKDLALLQLKAGSKIPEAPFVFQAVTGALTSAADVYAVGYPLTLRDPDPTFLQVRRASVPLRDILPVSERTELGKTRLDLNGAVISLQGPLVPGLSGCPIVDERFQLVGMGHGGLEGGNIDRCWAIPSSGIAALNPETCSKALPASFMRDTLFGAAVANFLQLQEIDPAAVRLDPGTAQEITVGGSAQRDVLFGVYTKDCGLLSFKLKNLNRPGVRGIVRAHNVLDTSGQKLTAAAGVRPGRETTIGPIYVSAGRIYLVRVYPKSETLAVGARIEATLTALPQGDMGETSNTRQTAQDISQVRTVTETVGFGRNAEDWFKIIAPQTGAFTLTVENHAGKGTQASLAPVLIEHKGKAVRAGGALPGRTSRLKGRIPVSADDEILICVKPVKAYRAAPYRLTWYLE